MTLHRYMLNRRLARATPLPGRVLEIGNGRQRRGLATGATVTLDLSDARQPDVQGDALALPFADGTFDAVVCCETLQYVWLYPFAVDEMLRVMKRDGALILSLPWKLARQADERALYMRWRESWAAEMLARRGLAATVTPLWPPWRLYTSGWFVEARAA